MSVPRCAHQVLSVSLMNSVPRSTLIASGVCPCTLRCIKIILYTLSGFIFCFQEIYHDIAGVIIHEQDILLVPFQRTYAVFPPHIYMR
jgi:hypothetical protein